MKVGFETSTISRLLGWQMNIDTLNILETKRLTTNKTINYRELF